MSCGEASGDLYAGELVREIRLLDPAVHCFGMGGGGMTQAGAELVVTLEQVTVLGLVEVLGKIPALRKALRTLVEAARVRKPAAAVLIDFSGFHLRLARRLKALGVPVVYYVSPQVWAWRRGRVETIRETVDLMLVILPFEEAIYREAGVPVTFVGHPLVDLVRPRVDRAELSSALGLDPNRPLVAILPGSRRREIELHVPILAQTVEAMIARQAGLQFLLLKAPTADRAAIERGLGASVSRVTIAEGVTYEGLAHADVALVASGTATVETALSGTPMVVFYRLGQLSYALGRRLVRVPHVAMVNLIAGRALVPELIQDRMTGPAIAEEAIELLVNLSARDAMRRGLAEVKAALGGGGASKRAAEAVLRVARPLERVH